MTLGTNRAIRRGSPARVLSLALWLVACASSSGPGPAAPSGVVQSLAPKKGRRSAPHSVALVIGIEKYKNLSRATGASYDAVLFADYAEQSFGIPRANIHVLLDENATLSAIKAELEDWLPHAAHADGDVLVFFAGHGAPDPDTQPAEGYLVPWETTPKRIKTQGLRLDDLLASIARVHARHVYTFLDACFTGAGGRSVIEEGIRPVTRAKPLEQSLSAVSRRKSLDTSPPAPLSAGKPAKPKAKPSSSALRPPPLLASALPSPARSAPVPGEDVPANNRLLVLTATGPDEYTGTASSGRGLFSHYLFEGLRGKADRNHDDEIAWSELVDYATEQVANEASRQNHTQRPRAADTGLPGSSDLLALAQIDPTTDAPFTPPLPPEVAEATTGPKLLLGSGLVVAAVGVAVFASSLPDATESEDLNEKAAASTGNDRLRYKGQADDAADRANNKRLIGGVLIGLGAVGAGAGIYWWRQQATAPQKTGLRLQVGPGVAGLGWGREWLPRDDSRGQHNNDEGVAEADVAERVPGP